MGGQVGGGREGLAWHRRQVAIQRGRLGVYAATAVLASVLKVLGGLEVSWPALVWMNVGAIASVGVFWLVLARIPRGAAPSPFARLVLGHTLPAWVLVDLAATTVGVGLTGGAASPWYLLYTTSIIGAGFSGGGRSAAIAALLAAAAYLGVLGELGALSGSGLPEAIARLSLLVLGTFVGLLGALDLQRKRDLIRTLETDEEHKVAQLTRLTSALDQRTRELADANLRILEADRQKSQFLASMSHELRTPLNSIIGFSEILATRLGPTLEPKHSRFLTNIHGSGTHLLGLINDILDLTRIESGKMEVHPEKLKVAPLVEGVLSVMRGQAARRDIELVADVPDDLPVLEVDESRVKQTLFNLISNAVKFSPDGARVTCTVRARGPGPDAIEVPSIAFEIRDQGIGIDPADHLKVFQEFRQLDDGANRRREGTGLGLALVKKFVELHGGVIRLRSRLGEGASFTVMLPRERSPELRAAATSTVLPLLLPEDGRPRVLVIEDDLATWERISSALERAEYHAARARTGEEALVLARALRPSAITLDLVLPGIDGWEVLRRLKADPDTRDVPVIIVSVMEGRDLGVAMGANGYFIKPPDGASLVGMIAQVLGKQDAVGEVKVV